MATRRMHEIRRVTALTYFQAYALTQRKNYRAGPQRRWSYVAAGRRRHPYTSVEEHADTQARINTRSTASWLCLDTDIYLFYVYDTDVRRRLRTQSYLRDVKIA